MPAAVPHPNPNRCERCLVAETGAPRPTFDLADFGECGACGELNDVFDPPLLAFYAPFKLDPYFISAHLPRLRCKHLGRPESEEVVGWAEVARELARHVRFHDCSGRSCQGYALSVRVNMRVADPDPA